MMETTSHSFVRRARLSTAAIALAVCVTVAAIAAVFYTAGDDRLADIQAGQSDQQYRDEPGVRLGIVRALRARFLRDAAAFEI